MMLDIVYGFLQESIQVINLLIGELSPHLLVLVLGTFLHTHFCAIKQHSTS